MALSQKGRVGRKPTGGRYVAARKKRRFELGRHPTHTKTGDSDKRRVMFGLGGNSKVRVLEVNKVNLFDPKKRVFEQVETKIVVKNPASRHFVRRNIVTKGAVLETVRGQALVTSRPGQDGTVNAVLVKEKSE